MKRKITIVAVVLGIMVSRGAAAQGGMLVMDLGALATAIENGYTMTQQLQSMYNSIKTSYNQLQQQIKSFESFDFKALDAKDPLGSWRSLTTYADRMATYEKNIGSIINKKDIKIGNGSYSLSDVFINVSTGIDPFEKMLSQQEKSIFIRKYGMSYGNYMRIDQMREMLQKKAAEIVGYSSSLQKDLEEDRERLSVIIKEMNGSESAVQQQQINNAMLSIMAQDMKTQANLVGSIANQLATAAAQVQMEKEAIKNEINMNSLGVADGFLKMLDDMAPASAYR